MPKRIARLPVDGRGYPIPFFVAYIDGKPEFRAMDPLKWLRCVKEKRCWVCGVEMGRSFVFVSGPMCGISRTSGEPPSHYDCAKWSAINCPWLSNPKQVRREDELLNDKTLKENTAGTAITRNPGVTMLWITRSYTIFHDGEGAPLIEMGEPEMVEWYTRSREATRAEVQESVDSGLHNLVDACKGQRADLIALDAAIERFKKRLPEI